MAELKVDMRVPVGRPLPELADFAARCKQASLNGVQSARSPSHGSRCQSGPRRHGSTHHWDLAVSRAIQRRHPTTLVIAALVNSLDELAPGRAITVAPFPNPVVAESLLDRLINTSHQVLMDGPSFRPRQRPRPVESTTTQNQE
jgi:hypothetical protein